MASSSESEYIDLDSWHPRDQEKSIDIFLHIPGIVTERLPPKLLRNLRGIMWLGMRLGIFREGNTSVDETFKDESFCVLIKIFDKGQKDAIGVQPKTVYRFEVESLPGNINPDLCRCKLKTDYCIVVLQKKTPGSWKSTLDKHGLNIKRN